MSKNIEANTQTIIKFWVVPIVIIGIIFFLYKALTGLVIIGVSIFMALAIKPLVHKVDNFFTKRSGKDGSHQALSVIFAYLIVVLVIGAIIAIVGPVVIHETAKFVHNFPETFEKTLGGWDGVNNFGKTIGIDNLQNEISNGLNSVSNNVLGLLGTNLISSVSGFADIMTKLALVLVLTLLFLLEGPTMMDSLWAGLGSGKDKKAVQVARDIVGKMANVVSVYVSRQIVVAAIDGCAATTIVFILSLVFGFSQNLAIPMGMTTMIFYLIPMFGQFIGGSLVTLLLFFSNPLAALIFAATYVIYAQLENNLIAPKIQGNALNLRPVVILCAIVIGMYMFGLLGAIIAVPIAGCIRVLLDEYPNIKAVRSQNDR